MKETTPKLPDKPITLEELKIILNCDDNCPTECYKIQTCLMAYHIQNMGVSSRKLAESDTKLGSYSKVWEHMKLGKRYFESLFPIMEFMMKEINDKIKNEKNQEKKIKLMPNFMKKRYLLLDKWFKAVEKQEKDKE
jgi:hypothetical protein